MLNQNNISFKIEIKMNILIKHNIILEKNNNNLQLGGCAYPYPCPSKIAAAELVVPGSLY